MGLVEGYHPELGFISYDPEYWCVQFRLTEPGNLDLESMEVDIVLLVGAYIGLATDYAEQVLPTARDFFEPPGPYYKEMKALARCGFAEQKGSRFRWIRKISPIMRALFLWTDREEDYGRLEEARRSQLVEDWWNKTPEHLRRQLARRACKENFMDFFVTLRDEFRGLYLSLTPDGEIIKSSELETLVVRALYERFTTYDEFKML